jgi:TonB family protein
MEVIMRTRFWLSISLFFLIFSSPGFAGEPKRLGDSSKTPKIIKRVSPVYPEEAKKAKTQGTVVMDITINEQGKVSSVKIIESANSSLAEAAINAIKQWEYEPVLLEGKPVAVIATVKITFALE